MMNATENMTNTTHILAVVGFTTLTVITFVLISEAHKWLVTTLPKKIKELRYSLSSKNKIVEVMQLSHRHAQTSHFHPVTAMCYRKSSDGVYEFYQDAPKLYYQNRWTPSGMKTGFIPFK